MRIGNDFMVRYLFWTRSIFFMYNTFIWLILCQNFFFIDEKSRKFIALFAVATELVQMLYMQ